ncbi:MAG: DUF2807 domain-containing protein [Oscillospiraceae bacterium]|nr:DUF2807 domain-containing protein [Oscillospiraceae bacterium]
MKHKKLIAGILILVLTLSLAACGTPFQSARGSGVITDTAVPIDGSFNRVVSQGSFDVILSNEPSDSILFQLDENLLSYVELNVRVSGNTLYLATRSVNNRGISPTVFQFHVGVADLTAVNLAGSGSIRNEGVLHTDTFEASITGSGDMGLDLEVTGDLDTTVGGSGRMVLRGTADHVNVTVSGSGTADLRGVPVQNASARVSGSGEARLYVTETLDATVSGSGDIFYHGNPQTVTQRITGSGSISGR